MKWNDLLKEYVSSQHEKDVLDSVSDLLKSNKRGNFFIGVPWPAALSFATFSFVGVFGFFLFLRTESKKAETMIAQKPPSDLEIAFAFHEDLKEGELDLLIDLDLLLDLEVLEKWDS